MVVFMTMGCISLSDAPSIISTNNFQEPRFVLHENVFSKKMLLYKVSKCKTMFEILLFFKKKKTKTIIKFLTDFKSTKQNKSQKNKNPIDI